MDAVDPIESQNWRCTMQAKSEKGAKETLREIAARDPAFRRFLCGLRDRLREPINHETPLTDLTNLGASRAKAVDRLRLLQEAGYGFIKLGRRGLNTRFVWATSVKEVARDLIAEPENPQPESTNTPIADMMFKHTFLLRPGLLLAIELPLSLSGDESRRLAEFVRSLPFQHGVGSQDAAPAAED
jgi:hypothetical protein